MLPESAAGSTKREDLDDVDVDVDVEEGEYC